MEILACAIPELQERLESLKRMQKSYLESQQQTRPRENYIPYPFTPNSRNKLLFTSSTDAASILKEIGFKEISVQEWKDKVEWKEK